MKKTDLLIIMKAIQNYYPSFKFDAEKRDFWYEIMKDMDSEGVKKKLVEHVKINKFPPTIAEISVKIEPEERRNDFLRLTSEWEENAVGKPRS